MARTLICFYFVLSSVLPAGTQTYRYTIQQGFNSTEGKMQLLPDSTVRVIGIASDDWWFGSARVGISSFDLHGARIGQRLYPSLSEEDGIALDCLPLQDGSVVVAASLVGCDYGQPVTLARIDLSGDIVWRTEVLQMSYTNHLLLQMAGDSVFHIDGLGSAFYTINGVEAQGPFNWEAYDNMVRHSQGYLASRDHRVFLLDPSVVEFLSTEFSAEVLGVEALNGGRSLVATTDSVFVLGPGFERLKGISFNAGIIDRVFGTRSHYWLADLVEHRFYRFDTMLDHADVFDLTIGLEIRDIIPVGDTVLFSGEVRHRNSSMFLIQTNALDFSAIMQNDIGVTDIRLTDTAVYEYVDWGNTGGYPVRNVDYGPVLVTLQNFGSDTLNKTEVRFEEYACPGICAGVLQYSWELDGLALAPGESKEFYLDDLNLSCTYYNIHSLCLYTINPGNEPDANPDNDRFCVQVDVITDVSGPGVDNGISIYPNPTSERIFVTLPEEGNNSEGKEVIILDTHGRKVLSKQCHQGVNEIELNILSKGIYIVCIGNAHQMLVCSRIVVI